MARQAIVADWQGIREAWERGATSQQLAMQHNVDAALIRMRASRGKWLSVNPKATNRAIVERASKVAANRAVAKYADKIQKAASHSVEACIEQSIALGQKLMLRAERSVEEAEDGSLGSVASVARTGVDIWRKSLGLDATGSGSVSCAIQFNFVARGSESFPDATSCGASVTDNVTVDV